VRLACDTPVVASILEVHREVGQGFRDLFVALSMLRHGRLARSGELWIRAPSHRPRVLRTTRVFRRHYRMDRYVRQHLEAYAVWLTS